MKNKQQENHNQKSIIEPNLKCSVSLDIINQVADEVEASYNKIKSKIVSTKSSEESDHDVLADTIEVQPEIFSELAWLEGYTRIAKDDVTADFNKLKIAVSTEAMENCIRIATSKLEKALFKSSNDKQISNKKNE